MTRPPATAGLPPLSVVIVNWNGRELLRACLDSLRAQSYKELEVVVVDNGSEDGSPAMVSSEYPEVVLVALGRNLGFAAGCNRGIEASSHGWVCALNNDTLADPDWAVELARGAASAPDRCGMLQSRMLFMDEPLRINSTGIEVNHLASGSDRDEGLPPDARPEADEIFCPTAGACAYRRQMLDAVMLPVGVMDPRHFCYYEDLDLGWRARLAGWSARYVPSSVVRHHYHASTRRHGDEWLQRMAATNYCRTLYKNASWRLIFRCRSRIKEELERLRAIDGWRGLAQASVAITQSVATRRAVAQMARVDRKSLERTWFAESSPSRRGS